MNSAELVEKCKLKDKDALSNLYKVYFNKMLGVCQYYVQDVDIAHDLVHDGFIIVFTSLDTLRDPNKLENWIKRIMINLSLKYLNNKNQNQIIHDIKEEQQPDVKENEDESIPLDILTAMVDRLPDGYRTVFKLSIYEGLSHKEISEILNIEPKSSSSQLFHARQQLRRMIIEYRMQAISILTLLIVLPLSYYIFVHNYISETKKSVSYKKSETVIPIHTVFKRHIKIQKRAKSVLSKQLCHRYKSIMNDSVRNREDSVSIPIYNKVEAENQTTRGDSLVESKHIFGNAILSISTSQIKRSRWLIGFSSITEQASNSIIPKIINGLFSSSSCSSHADLIETWEDLNQYITYDVGNGMSPIEKDVLKRICMMNKGQILTKRHYDKPLTLGLYFYKTLSSRWGLETGLQFTRLSSLALIGNSDTTNISAKQNFYFLGVPIKLSYSFVKYKRFSLCGTAGFELDIPLKATSKIDYNIDHVIVYSKNKNIDIPSLQWSVSGGIGISYKLLPHIQFLFSPNLHYYFHNENGEGLLWQDKPLQISWPIGIRLTY